MGKRYRRYSGSSLGVLALGSIVLSVLALLAFQSVVAGLEGYSLLAYQRVYSVYYMLSNATRDPTESYFDFVAFLSGVRALASYVNGVQLYAPCAILDFVVSSLFFKFAACIVLLSAAVVAATAASRNPRVATVSLIVLLVAVYVAVSAWNIASILSLETRIVQLICVNVDYQLTDIYGSEWGLPLKIIHRIEFSPRDLLKPSLFSMLYYGFAESHRAWILEVGSACTAASFLAALLAAKATK